VRTTGSRRRRAAVPEHGPDIGRCIDDQVLAGLAEVDDVPRRRDLLGLEGLVLGPAGDIRDDDVDRQDDPDAVVGGRGRIRRASSTRSGSARLLPIALPASRNVLAMPPPRMSMSTLVSRWSMT
jgi:hypothetical protein